MEDGGPSPPIYWALLIGINLYPDDDETGPLEGCVRDVEQFQQCFDGQRNTHTTVLRASVSTKDDGHSSKRRPSEDEQHWPTLENVRSAILTIMSKASPGDVIHIHFSGHGVRRKTQSKDFGEHENGDLALVLYDPVSGVRYLQGLELTNMLKEMVDKGLKPVLVLDCCYSGAVLRDGQRNDDQHQQGKIREAVYNAEIDQQSSRLDLPEKLPNIFKAPTRRDATTWTDWFLEPDGYAILTACGPGEVSRELEFKDKSKSGPLSYFLHLALKSMQRRNVQISLKSIHDYVSVQFHAGLVKQTPRRYGNEDFGLFSHLNRDCNPLETRVRREKERDELILEAGQVHGVAEDDRYCLRAVWDDDYHPKITDKPIVVKVKTVHALTSAIEAADATVDISGIKTGWRAVPCTHLSQRQISVGLSTQLHQRDQWQKIIAASSFLTLLLGIEGKGHSSLLSGVFIDIKEESDYQILDERKFAIPGLPTVPIARSSAISETIQMLDHVAKFKYIERLENRVPDGDFERSVGIHLVNSATRQVAGDLGGVLNVTHGDTVELRCVNFSDKPVYLSVFDLSPLWRIENLLRKKYGDYKDLPTAPSGPSSIACAIAEAKPLSIKMTVPEELNAQGKCDDVIKVFVTSRPVSLSSLRLAAIKSPNNRGSLESTMRSSGHNLLELLERLSPTTRGVADNIMADERWLTRNFVIHVSKRKDGR